MALARKLLPPGIGAVPAPLALTPSTKNAPAEVPGVAQLRQDIALFAGPRRPGGTPGWVLEDPAANLFYTVGWREFEILSRWQLGAPAAIADAVCAETTLSIRSEHVGQVAAFLQQNGLLRQSAAKLLEMHAKSKKLGIAGMTTRTTGEILFRKIPLLSPDEFLSRTLWLARPFFGMGFLWLAGTGLLLALYLVGRQWGQFIAAFDHLYSVEGAVGVALALTVAKAVHELSHAYVAKLHGVEVPSMGVSLILFWPILYTETSGAWRLTDRRKRLSIAVAGVVSELVLAVLALLVWPFLDAGWLRDTMQFAASSLVVLSLAINANPLMRFDGYFVLCDVTGLDNLQPRSLAVLGWAFRRLLAGTPEPSPEPGLSMRVHTAVMAFGAALGLYRISLYSGIAYGLTASVWPAFGLTMAVLVIVCFLAQPLFRESVRWFRTAGSRLGPVPGAGRVLAVLALFALPLVIPWRTSLLVPVVLRIGQAHAVFAPEPGAITRVLVADGQQVSAGEALIELASPDLSHRLTADRLHLGRLAVLLDQHLTQSGYQEDEHVEGEEIARLRTEITGLEARLARLILRAPSTGVVRDVEPGLKPGAWVREDRPLLRVVAGGKISADAYIEERDLYLVGAGAPGSLWLDGQPFGQNPIKVHSLYDQAIARIDAPIIAGPGGGPIQVRQSADRNWVPETAIYKAELELTGPPPAGLGRSIETRGFASIETPPRNLIGRIWDRIVGVWRREIG